MQPIAPTQISSVFIWRRVHSLMGFWLVLYLILHLITNSQAALWLGNEGNGFVRMVNSLESLPYLHAIEVLLIGVPLAIHLVWGVHRALTARSNSLPSKGGKPSLKYERNFAYTLQRLSSWILLFGIIGHVVQMRFLDMPKQARLEGQEQSMVKLDFDEGLYPLSSRLDVTLYNCQQIGALEACSQNSMESSSDVYNPDTAAKFDKMESAREENEWRETLASFSLKPNQVVAVADSPGKAMLLMVRDTFKSPLNAVLYTIFLLAAAFHAFNGFWTFLITWGVILSYRSQKAMIPVCMIGMAVLALLGLAAIWGSYWLNSW
jgi:succinate dehydrogenase / fumarate reductase, cytochrome b subunit